MRDKAVATVQVDNDFARVTQWRFAPGAETGWHVHAMDYVVVPMTNGRLHLETREGDSFADLTQGPCLCAQGRRGTQCDQRQRS